MNVYATDGPVLSTITKPEHNTVTTARLDRLPSHSEDTLVNPLSSIRNAESPTHSHHHAHFDLPEGEAADTPHDVPVFDIEHTPVDDDPRDWSDRKKTAVLLMMSLACVGPMISPSIYNPVIDEVQTDLMATETQIGLSLSLYILFQGCVPVIWSSIAEIIGRKPVYLLSFLLYTIGSVIGSLAQNMSVLIGMRCLQAMGSSAVLSVGAGSLADMYEVHERGKKLGIYYGMPLMGPAIGPLIGGALGAAYGWRSCLYFLSVFAFLMMVMFFFFPDSWRRQRSKAYQAAMEASLKRALNHTEAKERKRQRKIARGLSSTAPTPPATNPGTPFSGSRTPTTKRHSDVYSSPKVGTEENGSEGHEVEGAERAVDLDVEKNEITVTKRSWYGRKERVVEEDTVEVRPTIRDINPLPPMAAIIQKPTNAVILFCSGLLFAGQYTIAYTAAITLARAPYNYGPLIIGVILLAFGTGNIMGSVLGGRYSDYMLGRMKKANGGISVPEMRLKSTSIGMPFVVASFLAYAWTAQYGVNIAGIVVSLFVGGFALMIVYSSTLAYLVDSNPGRSSSAIACNSFCRGASACVMSQVAIPIQNAIGDGGLYSLFAGLLAISCSGILLISFKGESWREPGHSFFKTKTHATSTTSTPNEKLHHTSQSHTAFETATRTPVEKTPEVSIPRPKGEN